PSKPEQKDTLLTPSRCWAMISWRSDDALRGGARSPLLRNRAAPAAMSHIGSEKEGLMRLPRLSANGWLLVVFGIILMGLVGEPAYRAITGRKSADELRFEKLKAMEAKYAAGPQVGEIAPPFTLKSSTDGHNVSLSDFKGRRVVMTFY